MNKIILLFIFSCLTITIAYSQTRDSLVAKQRLIQCTYKIYNADSTLMQKLVLDYRYSGKRGSRFRLLPSTNSFGFNYIRFASVEPEPLLAHMPAPYDDAYKTDVDYDVVYDRQYTADDSFEMKKFRTYKGDFTVSQTDSNAKDYFSDRMVTWSEDGAILGVDFYSRTATSIPYLYQTIKTAYNGKIITSDSIYRPKDNNNYLQVRGYQHDEQGRIKTIDFLKQRNRTAPISTSEKHEYTYGADGKLTNSMHWRADMNGILDTATNRTLSYDAAGNMTSYLVRGKYPFHHLEEYTYHYNEAGDMDTFTYWSGGKKSHFSYYIYDSVHNPVYYWQSNVMPDGTPIGRWYTQDFVYENYYDTIKIPVPQITDPIVLYPNPAGSSFTIRWNKDNPKRAVNISLYNPLGQAVRKYAIPQTQDEDHLDISGLASGIYQVEIMTTTGGRIYRGNLAIQGW